jgi:acyl-CoA thioester hydrolase
MIRHTTHLRVRYADTDQMKHVYYGRYFEYFEHARTELLRSVGLPYARFEEMGFLLPVIEAHAQYRRPARYDDMLEVVTVLREPPVARIRLDYEVYREGDADMLAEGYTVHSFVNASTGRPTRAPAQFLETLQSAKDGTGA